MATDPYGFADDAVGGGAPVDAAICLWTGVSSLILGAVAPCLCYAPWVVVLPLSIVSVYYGVRARSAGSAGAGHDLANIAGLVAGGVSLALSLLFVAGVVVYMGFFVALMLAGGNF
jgi:hypothetical protein